jgi:hypothetical protein
MRRESREMTGPGTVDRTLALLILLGWWALPGAACTRGAASSGPIGHNPQVTRTAGPVHAEYNANGRLRKIEYDRDGDGKPDAWGYMDGSRVVRVEVDENGDGKVDRWEYHRAAEPGASDDQAGIDRTLERIERATGRDGRIDRWEYFTDGVLTRVEEDTNRDGKIDKWETYEHGTLSTMALDTASRGKPDRRFVYAADGSLARIEVDPDATGTFTTVHQ